MVERLTKMSREDSVFALAIFQIPALMQAGYKLHIKPLGFES
jgi:hypothetical protein